LHLRLTAITRRRQKCDYDYRTVLDMKLGVVSSTIEPSFIPTGLIESGPTHMLSNIENRGEPEIKEKKSAEGSGRKCDILSMLNPDGKLLAPFRKRVV
jgi:hypothetical protein